MRCRYLIFCVICPPPRSPLFPYTTLFRSEGREAWRGEGCCTSDPLADTEGDICQDDCCAAPAVTERAGGCRPRRSEEHTSELQSRVDLVCRLLLEKRR